MQIALQILVGWFVIDFITGVYHWFIDHRKPTDPIIGSQVADFQEHHNDLMSMEKHGFVSRVWLTSLMGLPCVYLATFGFPAFWYTVFAGACVCQQAHLWAHRAKRPWLVRVLQQSGVLISPSQHGRHHHDFERSFGILNGWSHGALDLCLGRVYK